MRQSNVRCAYSMLGLGVLALVVGGVTPAGAEPQDDPCAGDFTDPTLEDCWECYLSLLERCDTIPDQDRKEWSYKGAFSTFEWCQGRIPKSVKGHGLSPDEREHTEVTTLRFDVREAMIFDFDFGYDIPEARMRVFVRLEGEAEGLELAPDEFWPMKAEDGLRIAIDRTTMHELEDKAVGLTIASVDETEAITWGLAMPLVLEDSYDLDGDGAFTFRDRSIAIERFIDEELEMDVLIDMFHAPLD